MTRAFVYNLKEERMEQNVLRDGDDWPRFGHSACYDESNKLIFLFGGKNDPEQTGNIYDNGNLATMRLERDRSSFLS